MLLTVSDNQAIIRGEERVNYRELAQLIGHASELYGETKVEKIAIFGENSINWVACFYSAWYKGVVPVPIDYLSSSEELAYMLKDSHPEIIFVSKQCEDTAKKAIELSGVEIRLYIIDDLEKREAITGVPMPSDNNDLAVIIYTSGTTGGPKGVMLSFENLFVNVRAVSESVKIYSDDDVVLCLLPCHHSFPLVGAVICAMMRGASIVMPTGLSSNEIFQALNDNGVTLLLAVPRFLSMVHKGIITKINSSIIAKGLFNLSKAVNSLAFSRFLFAAVQKKFGGKLRYIPCGGAALDQKVGRDLRALGLEILEGYGMTETAPMISFTKPGHVKVGAAGPVLPEVDLKIIDGEICVMGPNVMLGYYNRPDETNEIIRNGWLHTGDLGHLDNDGFLHITGRKKEIIVLPNGKNINPEEIERDLLERSPYLEDAGVFFHDGKMQALVYPNVSLMESDGIVNLKQHFQDVVIDHYNASVASYKKIVSFNIVSEELPRTRLGKMRRFMLPELLNVKEKSREVVPDLDLEEYRVIKDFLSVNTGISVRPTDHIEIDLGMDSLDKVNLISFLNNSFGINLTDEDLVQFSTIEKLSKMVADIKTKVEVENVNWSQILGEEVKGRLPRTGAPLFFIRRFVGALISFFFRVRWYGLDNMPDVPCIIAPNHQSYLDAGLVISPLGKRTLKDIYYGAKRKHIDRFLIRNIVSRCNVIGIDLNKDLLGSIKKMGKVIQDDKKLLLFPEGTRSKTGELGKFKLLFAIMARELNVPIVPVVIDGAFDALPSGSKLPKFGTKIEVRYLPAVFPEGKSAEQICHEVRSNIETTLNIP